MTAVTDGVTVERAAERPLVRCVGGTALKIKERITDK